MIDSSTHAPSANDGNPPRGGHDDVAQFHSWRLMIGTLAAPLAWFAQMFAGEVLTTRACAAMGAGGPADPPGWLTPVLIALSAACFAVGVTGVVVAWRTVIFTRARRRLALHGRARRIAELEWFLARVSVLSSAMFLFGLVSTDLAVWVLTPCGRW